MTRGAAYRGQPVLVLVLLAVCWAGTRIMLWDAPFARAAEAQDRLSEQRDVGHALGPMAASVGISRTPMSPGPLLAVLREGGFVASSAFPADEQAIALEGASATATASPPAFAMALPYATAPAAIPPFPLMPGHSSGPPLSRWSGDAWVLLRDDTVTPVTSGRGSYGRSQAGAVLRYRIVPSSAYRPTAYLRVSTSIDGPREAEAALGVSARPLPSVPIVVAAEMRGARFAGDTQARAAAFAYSELPPINLPFDVRGEAYVQGGYVGGRYATPFIDGQVRVDRALARLGPAELRAGGGAWGGAQKGAERLDVGPGATVALDLGGAPLRMSADWRFRIAGEANPSSGPALTVSAGF